MAPSFAQTFAITALLASLGASAQITSPVNGRPIQVVEVQEPEIGKSKQGDEPTVSKPDEVFTVGSSQAGVKDGEPVLSGRKLLQRAAAGRKLTDLDLSGDGESVGSSTAGADTKAYGHGAINGLQDTHIQPHGTTSDVSAAGQGVNGITATGNPDCVAGEGPCVHAGKK